MLLKEFPQDFIVNELYDLEQLREEKGESGNYAYFKFTKINLSQQKAIIFLAQKLSIASKRIHFCGTKDKVAITTQIISIQHCNEQKAQEFIENLNSESEDMKLEYIGQFNQRLNLSDNRGNFFEIILKEVNENDKQKFMTQYSEFEVFNFFQSQRFGVCNNTHKIGLLLIKNSVKDAVFEILKSLPQDIEEENQKYLQLCKDIQNQFEELSQEELRERYRQLLSIIPQFLNGYETIINHLINTPKDVSGALRTIPKKTRTLYIHAFQSAIFNEVVNELITKNRETNDAIPESVYLIGANMKSEMRGYEKSVQVLQRLDLTIDDLHLKHMPELQLFAIEKSVYSQVKNYSCQEIDTTTVKIMFELGVGCYATQVVDEIVGNEDIVAFD